MITDILAENVVQPLATETVRSILKIDDIVNSDYFLLKIKYLQDIYCRQICWIRLVRMFNSDTAAVVTVDYNYVDLERSDLL